MEIQKIALAPWHRGDWSGELVSVDGSATDDFKKEDVAEVIQYAETGDDWDGYVVGIVRLKDGRVVGWEAMWGPTGNGFSCDAYGGTADILFAENEERILRFMSEYGKQILRDYKVL